MIILAEGVVLTSVEADDPKLRDEGLAKARALGLPLLVAPPNAELTPPAPVPPVAPSAPDKPVPRATGEDHQAYMALLRAANKAGVPLVVESSSATAPPVAREQDVVITRAVASDHRQYQAAAKRAAEKGGVVIVA